MSHWLNGKHISLFRRIGNLWKQQRRGSVICKVTSCLHKPSLFSALFGQSTSASVYTHDVELSPSTLLSFILIHTLDFKEILCDAVNCLLGTFDRSVSLHGAPARPRVLSEDLSSEWEQPETITQFNKMFHRVTRSESSAGSRHLAQSLSGSQVNDTSVTTKHVVCCVIHNTNTQLYAHSFLQIPVSALNIK